MKKAKAKKTANMRPPRRSAVYLPLSPEQVVDLCTLIAALADYARNHACSAHLAQYLQMNHAVDQMVHWLDATARVVWGDEEYTEAIFAHQAAMDEEMRAQSAAVIPLTLVKPPPGDRPN